jgi:hypothetical protein
MFLCSVKKRNLIADAGVNKLKHGERDRLAKCGEAALSASRGHKGRLNFGIYHDDLLTAPPPPQRPAAEVVRVMQLLCSLLHVGDQTDRHAALVNQDQYTLVKDCQLWRTEHFKKLAIKQFSYTRDLKAVRRLSLS